MSNIITIETDIAPPLVAVAMSDWSRLNQAYEAAMDRAEAAERRVAELEARLADQEWRPVTEKPTENGDYLTWIWSNEYQVQTYDNGYWYSDDMDPLTHWRPLPPPPAATE